MQLLQDGSDLKSLEKKPSKLEKEIQDLFEKNLTQVIGLEFVKLEFSIQSYRLDTLAFNKESNSLVIIKYKRGYNYSVSDQGVSYLNILLKYETSFALEYNETLERGLEKDSIN